MTTAFYDKVSFYQIKIKNNFIKKIKNKITAKHKFSNFFHLAQNNKN